MKSSKLLLKKSRISSSKKRGRFIGTVIDRGSFRSIDEGIEFTKLKHGKVRKGEEPVVLCGDYDWRYWVTTAPKDKAAMVLALAGFSG